MCRMPWGPPPIAALKSDGSPNISAGNAAPFSPFPVLETELRCRPRGPGRRPGRPADPQTWFNHRHRLQHGLREVRSAPRRFGDAFQMSDGVFVAEPQLVTGAFKPSASV